jgi:putative flippase GtrA
MSSVNQIIKYSSVGIVTNSIGYIFYIFISNLIGINPPVAAILAGLIVIGISYYLNKNFTFKGKGKGVVTARKYYLLYFGAILAQSLIIFIFSNILGFAHEIVAGISLIIISCSLFLIQKFYFFSK